LESNLYLSIAGRPLVVGNKDENCLVYLPGLALAAILTWVVLMFGPGSTVVHQGSYTTVLLLFVSLSAWLATLPGLWPYVILTLQAALLAWGRVLTSPQ